MTQSKNARRCCDVPKGSVSQKEQENSIRSGLLMMNGISSTDFAKLIKSGKIKACKVTMIESLEKAAMTKIAH